MSRQIFLARNPSIKKQIAEKAKNGGRDLNQAGAKIGAFCRSRAAPRHFSETPACLRTQGAYRKAGIHILVIPARSDRAVYRP
jgi:hypothetical protein